MVARVYWRLRVESGRSKDGAVRKTWWRYRQSGQAKALRSGLVLSWARTSVGDGGQREGGTGCWNTILIRFSHIIPFVSKAFMHEKRRKSVSLSKWAVDKCLVRPTVDDALVDGIWP